MADDDDGYPCGVAMPGYPPCHLPMNHEDGHVHLDGQCRVGLMRNLAEYLANDPLKGVRWDRCVLFAGHVGEHEIRYELTVVVEKFQ